MDPKNPKNPKNPPKIQKLEREVVPMSRLGTSTLSVPIPAEHLRIHRAVIARALRSKSG
jgi:hypothetical protein